jgi:hypothetical protein
MGATPRWRRCAVALGGTTPALTAVRVPLTSTLVAMDGGLAFITPGHAPGRPATATRRGTAFPLTGLMHRTPPVAISARLVLTPAGALMLAITGRVAALRLGIAVGTRHGGSG